MQIVKKDGKVMEKCIDHHPPEIVKQMKKAGYSVREVDDGKQGRKRNDL